jgi:hypothetical protein
MCRTFAKPADAYRSVTIVNKEGEERVPAAATARTPSPVMRAPD